VGSRTMGRRRGRTTRPAATSKNAGTMTRTSVGMIDEATGPRCGVANHPICAGTSDLMSARAGPPTCDVVNRLMCAGVNGRTTDACKIVVAGRTPARAMVATTFCRMANAGLTFGGEQPRRPLMSTGRKRLPQARFPCRLGHIWRGRRRTVFAIPLIGVFKRIGCRTAGNL
jgi:hypothetical protein